MKLVILERFNEQDPLQHNQFIFDLDPKLAKAVISLAQSLSDSYTQTKGKTKA